MPIANCFIAPKLIQTSNTTDDLIAAWAKRSGIDSSEMTIMLTPYEHRLGKEYTVICQLFLPTAWSQSAISALQTGLSHAIADTFSLDNSQIFLMTTLVESGFVVEQGREVKW